MDNYDAIINSYLNKSNDERKRFMENWKDMRDFIHTMLSIDKIRNMDICKNNDICFDDGIEMFFYECTGEDHVSICERDKFGKRIWHSTLKTTYDYKYSMTVDKDDDYRYTFGDNLFKDAKDYNSERWMLDKPYEFVINWNIYKPIVKEWVAKKLMEN